MRKECLDDSIRKWHNERKINKWRFTYLIMREWMTKRKAGGWKKVMFFLKKNATNDVKLWRAITVDVPKGHDA